MREISIELTDYDVVADKYIRFKEKGYLITPNIVFSRDQIGLHFYYFKTVISEVRKVLNADKSKKIYFIINGGSIGNIDLEKIVNMTIADLAKELE